MSAWIRWLTHNVADTDTGTHADVTPLMLTIPYQGAAARLAALIPTLANWAIVESNFDAGTIHATHRTGLFRFVDDVHLRLEPIANGVKLHARSQSRLGKGDFGQNRRNILGLFDAVKQQLGAA